MTGEVRADTRCRTLQTRVGNAHIYISVTGLHPNCGVRARARLEPARDSTEGTNSWRNNRCKGMVGGEKKIFVDLPEGGHEAAAL